MHHSTTHALSSLRSRHSEKLQILCTSILFLLFFILLPFWCNNDSDYDDCSILTATCNRVSCGSCINAVTLSAAGCNRTALAANSSRLKSQTKTASNENAQSTGVIDRSPRDRRECALTSCHRLTNSTRRSARPNHTFWPYLTSTLPTSEAQAGGRRNALHPTDDCGTQWFL